jgi:hypothetical protein
MQNSVAAFPLSLWKNSDGARSNRCNFCAWFCHSPFTFAVLGRAVFSLTVPLCLFHNHLSRCLALASSVTLQDFSARCWDMLNYAWSSRFVVNQRSLAHPSVQADARHKKSGLLQLVSLFTRKHFPSGIASPWRRHVAYKARLSVSLIFHARHVLSCELHFAACSLQT